MWSLLVLGAIDWMQFGLAGVTFGTLATMFWRILKRLEKRDEGVVSVEFAEKTRKETLEELEKREARYAELLEKVIEALQKNTAVQDRMVMRLEDVEDILSKE